MTQSPSHVWNDPKFAIDESQPVQFMVLEDAEAMAEWLRKTSGAQYAVPTEEQWEFACRGGTATPWHYGDNPDSSPRFAWNLSNAATAKPVGRLLSNPFGLHDLHGNVVEIAIDPSALSPLDFWV